MKESEKNFDGTKPKTNFSKSRIRKIGKNLLKLEKNLSKSKKYHDYDYVEYKGIRDVKDLLDLSTDEDYYKPIIAKGSFNNSNI